MIERRITSERDVMIEREITSGNESKERKKTRQEVFCFRGPLRLSRVFGRAAIKHGLILKLTRIVFEILEDALLRVRKKEMLIRKGILLQLCNARDRIEFSSVINA